MGLPTSSCAGRGGRELVVAKSVQAHPAATCMHTCSAQQLSAKLWKPAWRKREDDLAECSSEVSSVLEGWRWDWRFCFHTFFSLCMNCLEVPDHHPEITIYSWLKTNENTTISQEDSWQLYWFYLINKCAYVTPLHVFLLFQPESMCQKWMLALKHWLPLTLSQMLSSSLSFTKWKQTLIYHQLITQKLNKLNWIRTTSILDNTVRSWF